MEVQAAALIMPSASTSSSSSAAAAASTTTHPLKAWNTPSSVTAAELSAIAPENDPNPTWTFYPPSATYIPPSSAATSATITHPTSPGGPTQVFDAPSSPASRSPRSSPPPSSSDGASSNHHPNAGNSSAASVATTSTASLSSTPSTHHRILDHCFHVSIETRLQQAETQYLASIQEQALEQQQYQDQSSSIETQSGQGQQDDWRKRQQSLVDEAVVLGRKGSNVEAIVDGILKSHRSNGPLQTLPRHLKHRLHLCQLTSMVFGRFDVASSTNNSAGLNIYSAFHSRRHGTSRAAIKHRFSHSEQGKQLQSRFSQPIPASNYCRRHHRRDCKRTCCTLAKLQQEQQQALEVKKKMANNYFMNNSVRLSSLSHGGIGIGGSGSGNGSSKQDAHAHQRVTGLVDAIPAFLKCSAMSYRDIAKTMVEKGEIEEMKDMKVLEGWYKLLLEMMTQAVIESFLCDEDTGFDTVLDVFSFGDDPEDTAVALKDFTVEDSSSSVVDSSSTSNSISGPSSPSSSQSSAILGVEGLQFQTLSGMSTPLQSQYHLQQNMHTSAGPSPVLHDVTTQDRQDDILFAKTAEYKAFKATKDERLKEFLTLNGLSMEQHFADLAAKYPLIVFERQMTHFIARSQQLLVDPKLSQSAGGDHPPPSMGLMIPPTTSAYADGSLSMPVSEDEDEDEDMDDSRVKLEEIKEEDEEEEGHSSSARTASAGVGAASVVVIKEGKKKHHRARQENGEEEDDDDNSTAARVVQVSKKHKHHHQQTVDSTLVENVGDTGHASKKVKV
ncbi:hypothetical protein EDD11_007902 [Mortierella claussenii]|nr:hypothetical protein EDD11_007902 [Mortierella claussenii]